MSFVIQSAMATNSKRLVVVMVRQQYNIRALKRLNNYCSGAYPRLGEQAHNI